MPTTRILTCFVIASAALLGSAVPAAAEFTSEKKTTKGVGEFFELNLVAGGATVQCRAFEEGSSKVTWTIKNSKEAAEKGAHLILNTSSWGECTAKASKLEQQKASVSGCELEATETEEEVEAPGKVLSTCTIEVAGCTITAAAKENEKLANFRTYPSGEESDGVALESAVKNLVTKIAGECESKGIKASNEGILTGWAVLKEVQVQRVIQFTLAATRQYYIPPPWTTGTLYVIRAPNTGMGVINSLVYTSTPEGSFTFTPADVVNCWLLNFNPTQSCPIGVTYNPTADGATVPVLVSGSNNNGYVMMLLGGAQP